MEDKDVFDKHFERYPVIYLKFINITVNSHNKIIDALYSKSCEIMEMYEYFIEDPGISIKCKRVFNRLNKKSLPNIIRFYKGLCILLYQYYGIAPVILIDECDHPIREIMRKYPEGEDYEKVVKIFQDFYVGLFKENEHRSYSVFTGIDRLIKARVSSPLNLEEEPIISGDLVEYYSFSENDVEELLKKLEYTKHAHNEIKKAFKDMLNGYLIADEMIYNCFSIIKALKEIKTRYKNKPIDTESRNFKDNVLKCYWYQSYPLTNILNAFKSWRCSELFYRIFKEESISSPLKHLNNSENKLRMTRAMYSTSQNQEDPYAKKKIIYDMDIVLSFLVAHGYLTKKPNSEGIYDVLIPNEEMRESLKEFHQFLNLEMMKEDEKTLY